MKKILSRYVKLYWKKCILNCIGENVFYNFFNESMISNFMMKINSYELDVKKQHKLFIPLFLKLVF